MLYIGEQVGWRATPRRRSTSRSTRSRARTSSRPARRTRSRSSPHRSAAAWSTPRTRTSRSCASARGRGQVDITKPPAENVQRVAEALRRQARGHHRDHPRPPAARGPDRRGPLGRRANQADHRRRPVRRDQLRGPGTGVHAVMGIGGAPEGVITAAAMRCLGGEIQARFKYRNDDERARGARMGHGDESRDLPDRGPRLGREPRLRRDRRHARRPPRGRPVLRRRGAHPLARDGLPDEDRALRRHRPHVRPRAPAERPALARGSAMAAQQQRILAIGGVQLAPGSTDWPLHQFMLDLTGPRPAPDLLRSGTASGENAPGLATFYATFARSAEPTHLDLFGRTVDDIEAFLLDQDVIFVGRRQYREHARDLAAPRRRQGPEGGLGGAASCSPAGPPGRTAGSRRRVTDSFGPDLDPLKDGLKLLTGSFCPHYDSESLRRPRYEELVGLGRAAGRVRRRRRRGPPVRGPAIRRGGGRVAARASTPIASSGARATPSRTPRSALGSFAEARTRR